MRNHDNDAFFAQPYAIHWYLQEGNKQPNEHTRIVEGEELAALEVNAAKRQGINAWYVKLPA